MKKAQYIIILVSVLMFSLSLHSGPMTGKTFSADMNNCVFTYTSALSGSFTASVSNGSGEMAGLTTANGTFSCTDKGNGIVYVFTTTSSSDATRSYTIRSNHLVDLKTGSIDTTTGYTYIAPPTTTTYTAVTVRIAGRNYASKTAGSGGSITNLADMNSTQMSINGVFK